MKFCFLFKKLEMFFGCKTMYRVKFCFLFKKLEMFFGCKTMYRVTFALFTIFFPLFKLITCT